MAITPYLLYEDAGAAVAWLKKAFGFRTVRQPMKDAQGEVRHADLLLGEHVVMLGAPAGEYKNPLRLGQWTQLVYVDVGNVARAYARAVEAGAKVIEEPTDTPYGARRFGVEDPEGHRWYFAQPLARPGKVAARKKRGKQATKKTAKKKAKKKTARR
jgi:uncharacterized glyoxalase superfamily protein PhnB